MMIVPRKVSASWKSPLFEMEKFQRDLGRFFDLTQAVSDRDMSLLEGYWSPAVDVLDRKDDVLVKADLPGLNKEDIEVTIENNVLSIRGEKQQDKEHKEGNVIRSERYYGSFQRSFTLPSTVDPAKVNARFNNGVLELVIAKKEEAKPRQIRVDVK